METHKTGCIICGRELQYFQQKKTMRCEVCGVEFESAASCTDNHFVCDECHSRPGQAVITSMALRTPGRNPITIAEEMMKNSIINMHGPEHHYLVIAALLAAFKNSGGYVEMESALSLARQRSEKVPGGVCGFWGSCGAGIGTGIFMSIITGATPLSVKQWQLANKMTSLSLEAISENGGPRCCKRDTLLAILTAIDFVKEKISIEMDKPEIVKCSFHHNNPSCKKDSCVFF
ncbi:SAM-dependent methyltransferase [Deltaproteobacteria bacterium Smac51]|nr:SAM-dependent methyltransferase [Deltaproteobacteria bacterium Smac51]